MTERLVCAGCGAPVARRATDGAVFHTESIPEGMEYHPAEVTTEAELLTRPAPERPPTIGDRQAVALERIAVALEGLLEHARGRPG